MTSCPDCPLDWTYNVRCQGCRTKMLRDERCRRVRQRMQADMVRDWKHRIVADIPGGCDCASPAACKWPGRAR